MISASSIRNAAKKLASRSKLSAAECERNVLKKNDVLKVFVCRNTDPGGPESDEAKRNQENDDQRKRLADMTFSAKDMFAKEGMATKFGCRAFDDAESDLKDSAVISIFEKQLGAKFLGKVAMTELALYCEAPTVNPYSKERTAGGSSCGSAVSVAKDVGMCHFSIGSQTGGSIIRPAAFNGVVGFKPTWNLIPMSGTLQISPSLDTIGIFTNTVQDCSKVMNAFLGTNENGEEKETRKKIKIGFFTNENEYSKRAGAETRQLYEEFESLLRTELGNFVEIQKVDFPPSFDSKLCSDLAFYEAARNLSPLWTDERFAKNLSPTLLKIMSAGENISFEHYKESKEMAEKSSKEMQALFGSVDLIVSPSTVGIAPLLEDCLNSSYPTGDPFINSAITMFGNPAMHLPLTTYNDMPLGLQVIGPKFGDIDLIDQTLKILKALENVKKN